ncbi:MAG: hypothetical protein KJN89_07890 [Gammaproteobacteria bacterium]|nr:hypothetical protein [Gammaproteobacteria bacterium]MBT8133697.1 hypothetical protein [Gammaproteobacteria bacterium]NNJ50282.1 hypothetical protein [Gammaproteobacteria bacterium]
MNILNELLETVQQDKAKVLEGLQQQDQDRNYKTPEVIAILELSFALVEASIMTSMEEQRNNRKQAESSVPGYEEN